MTRKELVEEIQAWQLRMSRKRNYDEELAMMINWVEILRAYLRETL
jgi:hypothetical protein